MAHVQTEEAYEGTKVLSPSKDNVPTIYEDLPLDPDYFSTRLLTILPGVEEEPLTCRLRSTKITAKTSYEALSYTWGDGNRSREILVNDHCFSITSNLEEALRALRRCDGRRTIWVDAVCINQDDLHEKGVYVRGMGYIYRMARQVLIWLGPAGQYTSTALRCIKHDELARKPRLKNDCPSMLSWEREEQQRELSRLWEQYRRLESVTRSGLWELSWRSWWRRVWVVQELCMAVGDPLLVCGHSSAPWTTFIRAMQNTAEDSGERLHILDMSDMRARARNPPRLRNFAAANNTSSSLLEDDLHWIRHTATFEASDPRDKLFALLALTRGPLRTQIEVDYSISVATLSTELMINQITQHHSLDLMALCHPTGTEETASWIPDLSHPGLPALPSSLPPTCSEPKNDPFTLFFRSTYARRNVLESIEFDPCRLDPNDPSVVTARGYLFGHVNHIIRTSSKSNSRQVWPKPRNTNDSVERELVWPPSTELVPAPRGTELWERQQSIFEQCRGLEMSMTMEDLEKCDRAFPQARLPVMPSRPSDISSAGIGRQIDAVSQSCGSSSSRDRYEQLKLVDRYENFLRKANAWAQLNCNWWPLFSRLSQNGIEEELSSQTNDEFLCWQFKDERVSAGNEKRISILHAMSGRCQFTTDTGLIGVGPVGMRTDDEIVMFDASSFAFAIRRSGRGHKLVGQVLICPPLLPHEYPVKEWLLSRPTDYPDSWRAPERMEIVLE